jgi:hypothetical protein
VCVLLYLKQLNLENAYENQRFEILFINHDNTLYSFEFKVDDTKVLDYRLDIKMDDEEWFIGVVPSGFLTTSEMKTFRKNSDTSIIEKELTKQKSKLVKL